MVRVLAIGAAIVVLALAIAFLGHDETVLKEEPPIGTIPTGDRVLVLDETCGWGRFLEVTGSVLGVPRERECVAAGHWRFGTTMMVHSIQRSFGKIYVLLVVIGSVAAGLAAISAGWRFLRRKPR